MIKRTLSITLLLASAGLYANDDLKLLSNALLALAVTSKVETKAGAAVIPDAPAFDAPPVAPPFDAPPMGDIPAAPAFDAPPVAPPFDAPPMDAPPLTEEPKPAPAKKPAGSPAKKPAGAPADFLAQIAAGKKLKKVDTKVSGEQPATPGTPVTGTGAGAGAGAAGTPPKKQPQTPGMMGEMERRLAERAARTGTPGKPSTPKAEDKKAAAADEETEEQKAQREAPKLHDRIVDAIKGFDAAIKALTAKEKDKAKWKKFEVKAVQDRLKNIEELIVKYQAYKTYLTLKDFSKEVAALKQQLPA